MRITPTELVEVKLIAPRIFEDQRGFVFEVYAKRRCREAGIDCDFVQCNHSLSHAGVVRGLHFQVQLAQAKLVRVIRGRIWDVAVDLRRGSPTHGRWVAAELSAANRLQLFIPRGFAHGFCALEESEVLYSLSSHYSPEHERGVAWDDPDLAVRWPVARPLLSPRDSALPRLTELAPEELPVFEAPVEGQP